MTKPQRTIVSEVKSVNQHIFFQVRSTHGKRRFEIRVQLKRIRNVT